MSHELSDSKVFRGTQLVHQKVSWGSKADRRFDDIMLMQAAWGELLRELRRKCSFNGVRNEPTDDWQELE